MVPGLLPSYINSDGRLLQFYEEEMMDKNITIETIEIPSAKETKSKTVELKRIFDERWELEGLKYVLNSIKDASKIGDFRTKINASRLTGGTVEKLRKAGYKVERDSNPSIFGTPQVIIDWSGKDETQIPED